MKVPSKFFLLSTVVILSMTSSAFAKHVDGLRETKRIANKLDRKIRKAADTDAQLETELNRDDYSRKSGKELETIIEIKFLCQDLAAAIDKYDLPQFAEPKCGKIQPRKLLEVNNSHKDEKDPASNNDKNESEERHETEEREVEYRILVNGVEYDVNSSDIAVDSDEGGQGSGGQGSGGQGSGGQGNIPNSNNPPPKPPKPPVVRNKPKPMCRVGRCGAPSGNGGGSRWGGTRPAAPTKPKNPPVARKKSAAKKPEQKCGNIPNSNNQKKCGNIPNSNNQHHGNVPNSNKQPGKKPENKKPENNKPNDSTEVETPKVETPKVETPKVETPVEKESTIRIKKYKAVLTTPAGYEETATGLKAFGASKKKLKLPEQDVSRSVFDALLKSTESGNAKLKVSDSVQKKLDEERTRQADSTKAASSSSRAN